MAETLKIKDLPPDVHEAKLIQTFPPDYVISGSWGEAMRQIGNAVPVLLAEKIGWSVINALRGARSVKPVATTYCFRKPRMEQMRLAIEKKRGYKGKGTAKGGTAKKNAGTAKKKPSARHPKSVKARYAKPGREA